MKHKLSLGNRRRQPAADQHRPSLHEAAEWWRRGSGLGMREELGLGLLTQDRAPRLACRVNALRLLLLDVHPCQPTVLHVGSHRHDGRGVAVHLSSAAEKRRRQGVLEEPAHRAAQRPCAATVPCLRERRAAPGLRRADRRGGRAAPEPPLHARKHPVQDLAQGPL
eukprot:CAMPEP_0175565416 /NCGR_PEP_ID=MMETSP0096-20121207/39433_1 /TAXON_ID=311494 /ORGANISM="Alexandrium monilatum, Strain CCMP3105" /LENGTH=165 /DNA_ID=CAMNT_0016868703 /DNA_START=48 /DNA_END=545 /DNA_ORIENTATION=-